MKKKEFYIKSLEYKVTAEFRNKGIYKQNYY